MKRERPSENGKIWLKREMRGYRGFISFLAILVGFSSLFLDKRVGVTPPPAQA